MKRTLLLLTVLAVTVGFVSTAFATKATSYHLGIPSSSVMPQADSLASGDTSYAAMHKKATSINLDDLLLDKRVKSISWTALTPITDADIDSIEWFVVTSYDDTNWVVTDSAVSLESASWVPKKHTWQVANDSLGTYLKVYGRITGQAQGHARNIIYYWHQLRFYDANGVYLFRRIYKSIVSVEG